MAKSETKPVWLWVDEFAGGASGDGIVHVWNRSEPPSTPSTLVEDGFIESIKMETALLLIRNLDEYEFADGPVEVR